MIKEAWSQKIDSSSIRIFSLSIFRNAAIEKRHKQLVLMNKRRFNIKLLVRAVINSFMLLSISLSIA